MVTFWFGLWKNDVSVVEQMFNNLITVCYIDALIQWYIMCVCLFSAQKQPSCGKGVTLKA